MSLQLIYIQNNDLIFEKVFSIYCLLIHDIDLRDNTLELKVDAGLSNDGCILGNAAK